MTGQKKKYVGSKSFFYGEVNSHYFKRYKSDDILKQRGLAPYLTSTQPVGGKHIYAK
jgi:hypothetical protein